MKHLEDGQRLGLIIFIALIMLGFIFIAGQIFQQEGGYSMVIVEDDRDLSAEEMKAENEPFIDPHVMPVENMKNFGVGRSLTEFYRRRAYAGAPPYIPHEVSAEIGKDNRCLSCHRNGGYVSAWKKYAPITPHPTYSNCRQCHVTQESTQLFVKTDWKSTAPPKLGQSALAGSPPPIPHGESLRTNCLACHYGAAAVEQLKTDHPERQNCRQCHVFQDESIGTFDRRAER